MLVTVQEQIKYLYKNSYYKIVSLVLLYLFQTSFIFKFFLTRNVVETIFNLPRNPEIKDETM